jgi:tetratricopeptide (TPR) repeat protein
MDFSRNPLLVWLNDAINEGWKYKKQILIGAVIIFGTGLLSVGYLFYKSNARTAAYKDFVAALKYYDGLTIASKNKYNDPNSKYFLSEQEKWQQTEQIFSQGYQKHKGTELGSMFLAFRSEALSHLGKSSEAIATLSDAINQMPSDEVKDYYKVKLSLIKIDNNDQQGLESLQQLADNEKSVANDLALYHIGNYYWNQKKFADAKNYWQRLLIKTGGTKVGQASPFIQEVKEKLNLFSTENL